MFDVCGGSLFVLMALFRQDVAPTAAHLAVPVAGDEELGIKPWVFAAAAACGIWYIFILGVQAIGFIQLYVLNTSPGTPFER
jgi:hypothetical protein